MRLRLPALLFLLVVLLSPLSALAQGQGSMFDPIIPDECKCKSVPVIAADGSDTGQTSPSAPNWGCVLKVLQNVINTAVGIAILVVVLAIVYAAFIFMTRGGNPGAREQGRNVIGSSLVGLLILLGAWLGVDFIMKIVYDPTAVVSGDTKLGPWNSIWSSNGDDMCIVVREPVPIATGTVDLIRDIISGGGLSQVGVARAPCPETNPGCSVSSIRLYNLTESQAQAMSCIAMTESSGDRKEVSPTGACGLFQITTRPGNWSNQAYHAGRCTTRTSCYDASCNLQTAMLMFRDRGYQPWTGKKPNGTHWNPNAVACVNKYDPGHPGTSI